MHNICKKPTIIQLGVLQETVLQNNEKRQKLKLNNHVPGVTLLSVNNTPY